MSVEAVVAVIATVVMGVLGAIATIVGAFIQRGGTQRADERSSTPPPSPRSSTTSRQSSSSTGGNDNSRLQSMQRSLIDANTVVIRKVSVFRYPGLNELLLLGGMTGVVMALGAGAAGFGIRSSSPEQAAQFFACAVSATLAVAVFTAVLLAAGHWLCVLRLKDYDHEFDIGPATLLAAAVGFGGGVLGYIVVRAVEAESWLLWVSAFGIGGLGVAFSFLTRWFAPLVAAASIESWPSESKTAGLERLLEVVTGISLGCFGASIALLQAAAPSWPALLLVGLVGGLVGAGVAVAGIGQYQCTRH